MKKTIVIYKSVSGFTKKYAELIAREMGCEAVELKRAKGIKGYDRIVFGGRLFAGTIDGLKKARELFAGSGAGELIVFATGATPNAAEDIIEKTWESNFAPEERGRIPHFYMQAGMRLEKLPLMERTMMKIMAAVMKRKKNKTAEEEGFADALSGSFDISSEEYIRPLVRYLQK